ncbi:hypothetical protein AVEN_112587-1 [Araneus ventricosus]|uniref:Uncharacterized protein n=1 Tax=Araneus ventricosus TaxID=182803 RepID=A0A4Y2QWA0_ARAVE|nr:hypothetical protein AVEN_112587-1 [Araneus ventricosus]
MDKCLKTETPKRLASRTEIRTDWPVQGYFCGNEMDWAKYCDVYTDGGKSMSSCYKGLRGRIKVVAPHVTWSNCCIYRQSLAAEP